VTTIPCKDGACPDKRNDSTVKLTQGDLMLCVACDAFRFRSILTASANESTKVTDEKSYTTVGSDNGGICLSDDLVVNNAKRELEVNAVLCFLCNNIENHPFSVVKSIVTEFYREDEIVAAKHMLIQTVSSKGLNIEKYSRRRIGDNKAKTTVDDILGILSLVDESGLHESLPIFCVADTSRLPQMVDDLSDITLIRNTDVYLRNQLNTISDRLAEYENPNKVTRMCSIAT